MSKINNILIIEAYTDSNIGSGALVENSVSLLKNKYPDSNIIVMAHYPKAFIQRYGLNSVQDFFHYPYKRSRIFQYLWLFNTLGWMFLSYVLPDFIRKIVYKRKLKHFYWADLIVSVGAERINDKYIKAVVFAQYTYAIVKRMKKKLVIFPSTFGPFLHNWTKFLFKKVFKNIDIVYSRDNKSQLLCNELLGEKKENFIETSDVAIFQPWSDQKKKLQEKYGRPIIGISVMEWTYVANSHETPYSNYKAYKEQMVTLIDKIIEKYKVHVILYPTNFLVHGGRGDDVIVCDEIYKDIEYKNDTSILRDLVSPNEFKSMLSASEINITTRMHACILSTGAYVPTISINYLFKLKEYMDSLGLSEFSIDIEDFEHSIVFKMFEKMWADRIHWAKHTKEKIEYKKKDLNEALNYLDHLNN
ncbi:MAG: hypothetical protein GQ564_03420 [Bacteroidales bacterium]|nr:hypothetical protein [Bacteroidales bacterium]